VDIGRFAVPFFTFAALFLAFQSSLRNREISPASYLLSRFQRIYLVFVAWCFVYAVVRIASDLLLKAPLARFSFWDFLWDGTAHHLWFLPFIFLASVFSFMMARWTCVRRKSYWLVVIAGIVSGLVLALNHAPNSFRSWGYTWELSVDALPSVLGAIAFAMTYARSAPELFNKRLVIAAGVLLWLGCLALLLLLGRNLFLETLSGLGLLVASLHHSTSPLIARIAQWGKFSFGIYILHILFLEGFQDVSRKIGWTPSWQNDVVTFMVTLLCCVIAIFLMNQHAQTRKLLL